jgi:hypothetical protein
MRRLIYRVLVSFIQWRNYGKKLKGGSSKLKGIKRKIEAQR